MRFSPAFGLLFAITGTSALAETIELHPGVLFDRANEQAIAMLPAGGVTAYDVSRGSPRWTSLDIQRPVALANGVLMGQGNTQAPGQLSVAFADVATGKITERKRIALPEGVVPAIEDNYDRQFRLFAPEQKQSDLVSWTYLKMPPGALDKTPELKTGGRLAVDYRRRSVRQIVGANEAKRVNRPLETELIPDVKGRQLLSTDGQHVLVTERRKDALEYDWTVYTIAGEPVGRMTHARSYRPFVVVDKSLLLVELPRQHRDGRNLVSAPLSLVSFDLGAGEQQWRQEVRDVTYRGPRPR